MRIRLTLKEAYTWASKYPDKPNQNDCGFINTNKALKIGQVVSFESLRPTSNAGDLNTDHYKYFQGKSYEVTKHQNGFLNLIEV